MRTIEILAAAREDYHAILADPDRHAELSAKMRKLMRRAKASSFTDLENGGSWTWYLWRFEADAPQDLDEFDYSAPELRFLDHLFKDEWGHFRPFGVFWWDTGMQVGTRYANDAGDVETADAGATPWFAFDYAKAKRFIPDITINGTTYDIIHDMRPTMVGVGQFAHSKGRYNVQRRVMQETSNARLGADAFGLDPWSPDTYVDIRRKQRRA